MKPIGSLLAILALCGIVSVALSTPNLPTPTLGTFSPDALEKARYEAANAPPLAPGWEGTAPDEGIREEPLNPHGNTDNDMCHYPRGTTLVVHIFVSHTGGTWTGEEMSDAAARCRVAKDWYRTAGPYGANVHFDNDGTTGYYYYDVTVPYDIPPSGMTYGMINDILTGWGFVDQDGDNAQVDDFTYFLQNWGGGWDNVATTWEPRVNGRSWAAFGLAYGILYFGVPGGVWAHEFGHMFGVCDEYAEQGHCGGGVDCGVCGCWYITNTVYNSNCELPACPSNIPCVMKANDLTACTFTTDGWAWRDGNGDGILDDVKRYLPGGSHAMIYEIAEYGYFSWNDVSNGMSISQRWTNWAVVGLRSPPTSDYDMAFYGDNGHNFYYAGSSQYAGHVDFVAGDYNHANLGNEHIALSHYSGPYDTYQLDFDGYTGEIYADGIERAGSVSGVQFMKAYDVPLFAGEKVRFTLSVQTAALDMGMALFRSAEGSYWFGRSSAQIEADWNGVGLGEEFVYDVPATDVYGLVLFSNTNVDGNFTIRVGGWPVTLAEEQPVMTGGDLQLYNYNPNAIYWSFVGCQPDAGTDAYVDLYDDVNYLQFLERASDAGAGGMEFLAVDYNHHPTGTDYLRVVRNAGSGNHTMEWEHDGDLLDGLVEGWWNTYHLGKAWDAQLTPGRYFMREYHANDTPLDTGIYLFRSDDGDYWKSKADYAASSDFRSAYEGGEWCSFDAATTDWYGVYAIVNNSTTASGSYSIWLGPQAAMPEATAVQQTARIFFGEASGESNYWTVYAARPNPGGATSVWLYNDAAYSYTGYCASDQTTAPVTYVVSDFNHSPMTPYYPRFLRTAGSSFACEWETGTEQLAFTVGGTNTYDYSWGAGHVAEMWDVYIDASNAGGRNVRFEVSDLSGAMDFGTAFFASNGGTYFADRSSALAAADAAGVGGTETVTVHLTRADWYGFLIYNKSTTGGNYRIRVIDAASGDVAETGPLGFGLRAATANPFAGGVTLEASLPSGGPASLNVYDVQGRVVRRLAPGALGAGRTDVEWDGADDSGKPVAGGVYFATLRQGGKETRIRLVRAP